MKKFLNKNGSSVRMYWDYDINKDKEEHKRRLQAIKSCIDNKLPPTLLFAGNEKKK